MIWANQLLNIKVYILVIFQTTEPTPSDLEPDTGQHQLVLYFTLSAWVSMSAQQQVLHTDTPAVWSGVGILWNCIGTGRTGHKFVYTQVEIPRQE